MQKRKGILLAGGTGSRLFPATLVLSKQLMAVYDKPMIYYPLEVLMIAGVREIAIVTAPNQTAAFRELLGEGDRFGLSLEYLVQPRPDGLPQAYTLAEEWLDGASSAMILGDNLFHGGDFEDRLLRAASRDASTIFATPVADPRQFGVVTFDAAGHVTGIEEKPVEPASRYAATGLYLLPGDAPARAAGLTPSPRGELEIADLLRSYLDEGTLEVECLSGDTQWFDTGTHEALYRTTRAIRRLARAGVHVGALEARAFALGLIGQAELLAAAARQASTGYGQHLRRSAMLRPTPSAVRVRPTAARSG